MHKRSKYRPRAVEHNPTARMSSVPNETRVTIMIYYWLALDDMVHGATTRDPWEDLAAIVNNVETLVDMKRLPEDDRSLVEECGDVMRGLKRDYKVSGIMRLERPGLEAVVNVLNRYERCLSTMTMRTIADANVLAQGAMPNRIEVRA